MTKVLVVVGATASGKTSLGLELAKRFNGEIISGDSVQVYRGLDIGSAKIQDMQGITHHLIDCLDADQEYSVFQFQQEARKKIAEITARNKIPILVGGTGLYLKACLYDYQFQQEDIKLDLNHLSNQELYDRIQALDPKSLEKIHINNRQRLLRALQICLSGQSKSEREEKQEHKRIYDVLMIGIKKDRKQLYQDIEKRVDEMFELGLVEEVESLLKQGIGFHHQSLKAIGYKEFSDFFKQEISIEEVKQFIIRNTKRYAKRQETWFNNQEEVYWVQTIDETVFEKVGQFLNEQ